MQNHKFSNLENKQFFLSIILFLILVIDSSFWFMEHLSGTMRISINFISILFLLGYKRKFVLSKKTYIIFFYLILFVVISGLISKNSKQTIIITFSIVNGFLFTALLDFEVFVFIYKKIIIFLSVFSLVTFSINILFPQLLYFLPIITVRSGITYYNAFFSVLSSNTYVVRNFGLFWEPGAYSIFLNIALFFELYALKNKKNEVNIKRITILLITIITTLSTLGIITMTALFISFYPQLRKLPRKYQYLYWLSMLILLFVGITSDRFSFHVFQKLNMSNGRIDESTSVRINSFIYPGLEFIHSPVFGTGYNNYLYIEKSKCNNMATFTYMNWLCIYGILGGIPYILGCLKFFIVKNSSSYTKFFLLIFSVLIFSTENFIVITFIYILVFYAFKDSNGVYAHVE
ncbi:hypothetical protein [Scatolibacter rhodanostii]|uniref:hypothetical protein n=1 Tax=Scatolibacter rhodanostii TaxID=2014781 RepID=UPI000C06F4FB|nr:hypothetical protein [Scatolibacter rhodanostii]